MASEPRGHLPLAKNLHLISSRSALALDFLFLAMSSSSEDEEDVVELLLMVDQRLVLYARYV